MVILKDSANKDSIKEQYDQLWEALLNTDEHKVENIIRIANNQLLTKREKCIALLKPFKTHLTWIIPLSALVVAILLYVIFIWVSLLVE
ncbi:hypothetical protein [Paenibacillus odorifer]|uniref:hypothetical protein n=1 Tax=Paenibacillus TaxID=44249 RepID=UPI00096F7875|nr:hypothetical protein [Paenibacillus odorifer]OME30924.1 hypothetical protein BSK63_16780 [Paenibacillus odorifer]OME31224.1 hypothetical protein BSK46_25855 [Paenibacillus odorifer]